MPLLAGGFVRPPPVAVSAAVLQQPAALSRFRSPRFGDGWMWGHAVLRLAEHAGVAVSSPLLSRWGRAPGFSVTAGYPGTGR